MGGVDNDMLTIDGVDRLPGRDDSITPDWIETGSNLGAAVSAGVSVSFRDARLDHLGATLHVLQDVGDDIAETPDELMVKQLNGWYGADVMTEPPAESPTDFQVQFIGVDVGGG